MCLGFTERLFEHFCPSGFGAPDFIMTAEGPCQLKTPPGAPHNSRAQRPVGRMLRQALNTGPAGAPREGGLGRMMPHEHVLARTGMRLMLLHGDIVHQPDVIVDIEGEKGARLPSAQDEGRNKTTQCKDGGEGGADSGVTAMSSAVECIAFLNPPFPHSATHHVTVPFLAPQETCKRGDE